VARPELFPGVSKTIRKHNILTLMWVIILMLNNVAEAVKECRSVVCSRTLTSWQIVLNSRIGWVEQNIWTRSKVRFDRVRATATY